MSVGVRIVLALIGAVLLAFAVGFFLQAGWATMFWPVPAGRLSNVFVASIAAAVGGPVIWIAASNEPRAIAAGALDLAVTNLGVAGAGVWFYASTGNGRMLAFGLGATVLLVLCLVLFRRNHPVPFRDTRPTPRPLRLAFAFFALALAIAATRLIGVWPNTFPWPLGPENSVIYGFIFLGAMAYFLYGLAYPVWGNAGGQMVGFVLYDLVLIGPFIGRFHTVPPEMLFSLTVYTSVVALSGLIGLWYLLADPVTRIGARHVAG